MEQDSGASPLATGLLPSVEPASGLAGSAAAIPSATAYDAWNIARGLRYHLSTGLLYRGTGRDPKGNGFCYAEISEWQLRQWLEIANGLAMTMEASAIEARSDETRSGSAEGESAIPQGDAQ